MFGENAFSEFFSKTLSPEMVKQVHDEKPKYSSVEKLALNLINYYHFTYISNFDLDYTTNINNWQLITAVDTECL
jgi:hypothetical protein